MHTLATTATSFHSYNIPWFMYALVVVALVVYALIELKHTRHDHEIGVKEAVRWSIIYVSAALLFAVPVFIFISPKAGGEYLAAWAIEKALSLDNLFVVGLIFSSFKVKPTLERRMLNYGIVGAIIFRLIFIVAGLELLKRFEWLSIGFGLILLHAAWKALGDARSKSVHKDEPNIAAGRLWRFLTYVLPIYPEFVDHKLTVKINNKRMLTMMAAVIIVIELTDIIFAVDSVPAVLAVSPDRFIAYSSNIFAILGLRALFFVYRAVAQMFWALNWALAGVLAWISFKLMAAPLGFHIAVAVNLTVLAVLLGGGIIVSLLWPRRSASSS